MNDEAFRREYLCEPTPDDPEYRAALLAWCEYYARCEAYDRTVCSGRAGATAIPIGSNEAGLVNRNARATMNEMRTRVPGFDSHERAGAVAGRMSLAGWQECLRSARRER